MTSGRLRLQKCYLDAGEVEDVRVRVSGHGPVLPVGVGTLLGRIQQGPVQRVEQFAGRRPHVLQVPRVLPAWTEFSVTVCSSVQ